MTADLSKMTCNKSNDATFNGTGYKCPYTASYQNAQMNSGFQSQNLKPDTGTLGHDSKT